MKFLKDKENNLEGYHSLFNSSQTKIIKINIQLSFQLNMK